MADEQTTLKNEIHRLATKYHGMKYNDTKRFVVLEKLNGFVNEYNEKYSRKCVYCNKLVESASIGGIVFYFGCCPQMIANFSFASDK